MGFKELEYEKMNRLIAIRIMGIREEFIHFQPGGKTIRLNGNAWHIAPLDRYTDSPDASISLRDKLSLQWNWLLGCGGSKPSEKPFGFALFRKDAPIAQQPDPAFIEEAETEEMAVVLCALRSIGVDLDAL